LRWSAETLLFFYSFIYVAVREWSAMDIGVAMDSALLLRRNNVLLFLNFLSASSMRKASVDSGVCSQQYASQLIDKWVRSGLVVRQPAGNRSSVRFRYAYTAEGERIAQLLRQMGIQSAAEAR
jgi:hypothetical protein